MKTILSGVVTVLLCLPGTVWAQSNSAADISNAEHDQKAEPNRGITTNRVRPMNREELFNHLKAYQEELIRAGATKRSQRPISPNPQMNGKYVKGDAMPSSNGKTPDASHGNRTVQCRFDSAPLEYVLAFYCDLSGKRVIADEDVSAYITVKTDHDITIPEAVVMVERALAERGIVIIPVGTNGFKASWAAEKKNKQAQPSHTDDGSTRAR